MTDANEALEIGEKAMAIKGKELKESEPTVFPGGAHYALDAAAKAERVEREKEIDATLREEGLVKDDEFKGLDADEALKVGEAVVLGGVEVTIDNEGEEGEEGGGGGDGGKKKRRRRGMPKKLRERMEKQKAAAEAKKNNGTTPA